MMPRRYRFIIAGVVTAVLVLIGGIAVAESGGQSAEHRKNPTTTTGEPAAPTTPTTTEAPKIQAPENDVEGEGEGNPEAALCHALQQGSEQGQQMKALHGRAFQPDGPHNLRCNGNVAPVAGGDEGEGEGEGEAQSGPPPWSNAGGNGGGGGQGGGGNPHADGAPGRNK
jgi:hypothetical protein